MDILVRKPNEGEKIYMQRVDTWSSDVTEFDYVYEQNETCLICEGSAEVEYDGKKVKFSEGDLVIFPKGLKCRWKVLSPIMKYVR